MLIKSIKLIPCIFLIFLCSKMMGQCIMNAPDTANIEAWLGGDDQFENDLSGRQIEINTSVTVYSLGFTAGMNFDSTAFRVAVYSDSSDIPNKLIVSSLPDTFFLASLTWENLAVSIAPTLLTPGKYWIVFFPNKDIYIPLKPGLINVCYLEAFEHVVPFPTDANFHVLNNSGYDLLIWANKGKTIIAKDSNNVLEVNIPNATYQWINCEDSSIIEGETNGSFTPSVNGNYAVIITENGCVDTSACVAVSNIIVVSLEETNLKNAVVFPNPFQNDFTIQLNEWMEDVIVKITDISGRTILVDEYYQTSSINIDLKEPSGIYFASIYSKDKTITLKLIKN